MDRPVADVADALRARDARGEEEEAMRVASEHIGKLLLDFCAKRYAYDPSVGKNTANVHDFANIAPKLLVPRPSRGRLGYHHNRLRIIHRPNRNVWLHHQRWQ